MMREDSGFGAGLAFGVLIGVPVSLFVIFTASKGLANIQWETLIAGGFATAGAAATVWMIRRQIAFEEVKLEKEAIAKGSVARLELNFALSEVCEHVARNAELLASGKPTEPYSGKYFETFGKIIEYGEHTVVTRVAQLVHLLQLMDARSTLAFGSNTVTNSLEVRSTTIVGYSFVYGLAGTLFDYARLKRDEPRCFSESGMIENIVVFKLTEMDVLEDITEHQLKYLKEFSEILDHDFSASDGKKFKFY